MEKNIISFKLNFLKNIGEMSEKKSEMLIENFYKEFPVKNEIPEGFILTKQGSKLIKSLLITPNQITYSQDGDKLQMNFDEPKTFVKTVYDKLYLNYRCNGIYSFSCLIDGGKCSSTLKSKLDLDTKDVQGIGIKVFLDNENYAGVFSFEPYLRDLDKCFCSLELQYKKQLDINELIRIGKEEALELFYKLIEDTYNKYE